VYLEKNRELRTGLQAEILRYKNEGRISCLPSLVAFAFAD